MKKPTPYTEPHSRAGQIYGNGEADFEPVSGYCEKRDHHQGQGLWVTQQHWAGCQGPATGVAKSGVTEISALLRENTEEEINIYSMQQSTLHRNWISLIVYLK